VKQKRIPKNIFVYLMISVSMVMVFSVNLAFAQQYVDLGESGNRVNSVAAPVYINDKIAPNIASFTLSSSSIFTGDSIAGTCTAIDNLDPSPITTIAGIDTSTTGSKIAICISTDATGNTNQSTLSYIVNKRSSWSTGWSAVGASTNTWMIYNLILSVLKSPQFRVTGN
jgi:hypothetical protein